MGEVSELDLAVLNEKINSITAEMVSIIERTCQFPLTAEGHDFSMQVFDGKGRLLGGSTGVLDMCFAGRWMVKKVLEKFEGEFEEGDLILSNDPYNGGYGTHLPDWAFFSPIFYDEELVGLAMARAHQNDPGGAEPFGYIPDLYDLVAEGVRIPPTKVFSKGEELPAYEVILSNCRFSDRMRMDHQACNSALKRAGLRLSELYEKFGPDYMKELIDAFLDRSENAMRKEIRKWPDGTYEAESATDDDGTNVGVPVTVRTKVTIEDDEISVDFTGSDGEVKFINSPIGNTLSTTHSAIFVCMPRELAGMHNDGSVRSIDVYAPEETCVNPNWPAPVGACPVNLATQIFEAIILALGKANPEEVPAPWCRHNAQITIWDYNPRIEGGDALPNFKGLGGSGAYKGMDGWPHMTFGAAGELRKTPIEISETRYPLFIKRYEMLPDSEGAGEFRGGWGHYLEFESETDLNLVAGDSDGGSTKPESGISGGKSPDIYCKIEVERKDGTLDEIPTKGRAMVYPGDTVKVTSMGGSGWGKPEDRKPEKVLKDVKEGLLSLERARNVYGVVIDPDTLEVDQKATQEVRRKFS